jgi:hypothetical protein
MSTFEDPGRDEPAEPATVPDSDDLPEEHDLERGLAPEDDPRVQPEPETPRDRAEICSRAKICKFLPQSTDKLGKTLGNLYTSGLSVLRIANHGSQRGRPAGAGCGAAPAVRRPGRNVLTRRVRS